jgi:AmiR/NasT family two-component response regulator
VQRSRQRLRILIAGHKDAVASRLRAQLEALGHEITGIVKDGPSAAFAAAVSPGQFPPDLIFLDQHLPPHDGIEAAEKILARQIVPIVLLIGYPLAGLAQRAQQAGVLTYLVWPTEDRTLRSVLEVAQTRFRELRIVYEETGDLHQALRSRMVIGHAKTRLMRRLGLAEAEAFGYLQRQNRRTGTTLEQAAEDLLAAEELCFGKPELAKCLDAIVRVLMRPKALEASQVALTSHPSADVGG